MRFHKIDRGAARNFINIAIPSASAIIEGSKVDTSTAAAADLTDIDVESN